MKLTEKKQRWVPHDEVLPRAAGPASPGVSLPTTTG